MKPDRSRKHRSTRRVVLEAAVALAVVAGGVAVVLLVARDRGGPSMSASEFERIWLVGQHVNGPFDDDGMRSGPDPLYLVPLSVVVAPVSVPPGAPPSELWAAHRIDTYHFRMEVRGRPGVAVDEEADEQQERLVTSAGCQVGGPIRVTVQNGSVTALRDGVDGCVLSLPDPNLAWVPLTVDAAFSLIDQGIDPATVHIRYHEDLGYPSWIRDQFIEITINDLNPGLPDNSARDAAAGELATHRALWQQAGISDYTYTVLVQSQIGLGPVTITVRDGETTDVDGADGRPVSPQLLTIEGLFSLIESRLEADAMSVLYHPELGYPLEIVVDHHRMAVDDEVRYLIGLLKRERP